MRRTGSLVLALFLAAPSALYAQAAERLQVAPSDVRLWAWSGAVVPSAPAEPASAPAERAELRRPIGKLAAVGLVAAAGSFVAGAYLGGLVENQFYPCTCDDPGLRGLIRGAIILPQIAIPLSVHLVDDGDPSFLRTLGGSMIGAALVTGAAAVAGGDEKRTIAFFGAPVGAVVGSVIAAR
jgi:hypothetical protein